MYIININGAHEPYVFKLKWVNSLINVIICDDDKVFADELGKKISIILSGSNIKAKIQVFDMAEKIGSEVLKSCDIAFLDIDFKNKSYNGIGIARKLRELRNEAVIVFVTNYIEFAPEGYEVQAFRYLLKEDITKKLTPCLEQILTHIRKRKNTMKISVEGEIVELEIRDIAYIEALGHTLTFHVYNGTLPEKRLCCYSTLSKMEAELDSQGFVRLHKSFIVNMAHIKKLTCDEVELKEGTKLRVSNKMYPVCRKKYMLWKGTR